MDIRVRSFDIFDTLVARRCLLPHNIFRAVETKADFPGFAEMRIKSEADLYARGEYNLDDIYGLMVASYNLNDLAVGHLKSIELSEEYDNLIPIAEHIAEVQPGDLLITDMYLPQDFIERVVQEKCGLHFNPIYLSSHGKSGGRAWRELTSRVKIDLHTGDNVHSDITMSGQHGIPARHTSLFKMTSGENLVEGLGYRSLAYAMRAARLSLWTKDSIKRQLGQSQIDLNFPLLFLTALLLMDYACRNKWDHLLFSSRDCFLLYRVFQSLSRRLNAGIRSSYFFTSRVARFNPSEDYKSYFTDLCGGQRALVVDMCGTG